MEYKGLDQTMLECLKLQIEYVYNLSSLPTPPAAEQHTVTPYYEDFTLIDAVEDEGTGRPLPPDSLGAFITQYSLDFLPKVYFQVTKGYHKGKQMRVLYMRCGRALCVTDQGTQHRLTLSTKVKEVVAPTGAFARKSDTNVGALFEVV